jgi:hypothetical protein
MCGAAAAVMVTRSLRTFHRYGNGVGGKPEKTRRGKVSFCGSEPISSGAWFLVHLVAGQAWRVAR